jgi:hypothetical protein
VAIIDKNVYLKPFGLASQDNSLGVPDFLSAMFRAGCKSVTFDLEECTGMDSTFLGVVASAASAAPHMPGRNVVILNASVSSVGQLQRIGLLSMVCLHQEAVEPPPGLELREIDFMHFPKTEYQRLERILQLHQELAQLNEKNQQNFGSFLAMLAEELRNCRPPRLE